MRRILASLDLADWFVVAAACVVLGWLQVTKTVDLSLPKAEMPTVTAQADKRHAPQDFTAQTRVLPLHLGIVAPATAKVYDGPFSRGDYFGAFAIGSNGRYGWSAGMATPEAARASAMSYCASVTGHCTIVGTLSPLATAPPKPTLPAPKPKATEAIQPSTSLPSGETYAPRLFGVETRLVPTYLSTADHALNKEYEERFAKGDYFGAFASGSNGGFGWATGLASPAAARVSAMANCRLESVDCLVVGTLSPVINGTALAISEETLSIRQTRGYRAIKSGSGQRAFARSLDGNWGSGGGRSPADNAATALEVCMTKQKINPVIPPMPCKLIAVWDR